jgi:hypothetical protein
MVFSSPFFLFLTFFSFLNGRNFVKFLVYLFMSKIFAIFNFFLALSPLIELKWSTICVNRAVQFAHNSTVDIEHNINETLILDSQNFFPFPHVGNVRNVHNKLATGISSERMQ